MTAVAVTCPKLTLNTFSAKLDPVNGGGSGNAVVPTTAADGWVISPPSGSQFAATLRLALFAGATETFTIKAGTRYPAQLPDLGDLTLAATSQDVRYVDIETARFLKSDGTITVTCLSTSSTLTAVMGVLDK